MLLQQRLADRNSAVETKIRKIMDYRLSTMKAVMNGKQNKKGFKAMEDKTIKEQEIDKTILHCKQKLDVSYYKYGPAGKNFGGGRVDALGSLDKCLIKFNRTKNTEYLEDAINYLLLRILFPMPGDHYTPTDSDGSAGVDGVPINME